MPTNQPDQSVRAAELAGLLEEIDQWWRKTSDADVQATLEKARDYDGIDLEIMGQAMEALIPATGELDHQVRHAMGLEMACAFYLLGKAARMIGAYRRGSVPKDDHWFDATVYTMMARRIRQTGRWT